MEQNKNTVNVRKRVFAAKNKWTIEMDEFLIKNYSYYSKEELATALGVSLNAIPGRARTLKIKRYNSNTIIDDKKWCPNCKQFLEFDKFFNNKSTTSGYASSCKACIRLYISEKNFQEAKKRSGYAEKEKRREEMYKKYYTCKDCGETKLGIEFEISLRKDGIMKPNSCKECRKKAGKENRRKRIIDGRDW